MGRRQEDSLAAVGVDTPPVGVGTPVAGMDTPVVGVDTPPVVGVDTPPVAGVGTPDQKEEEGVGRGRQGVELPLEGRQGFEEVGRQPEIVKRNHKNTL